MSTGIGNHKFSRGGETAYDEPFAFCPYCNCPDCFADWVDVGIGRVQCGPFYCPQCKASERSSLDNRKPSEKEKETGWYEPHTAVSEVANQVNGELVTHDVAMKLYPTGTLDNCKPESLL